MRKVTPRLFSEVETGQDITVKFTRIQGTRHCGQAVTHESEVTEIDTDRTITYTHEGEEFTFELATGYIRQNGDVLGRDASAKIE